ncbi:MAG TPA: hypothetical protein VFO29_06200 [Candidatus Rubrimentiphilum sp.]|nr:hypothetical protein [Candidatus Rubrimentiphilum sp.]
MPSAEYLTAYATIATFLVIAATATAAFIQLRHIHGANQLAGLLHLKEVVLLRRAASASNSMYENLEYLAVRAQDFETPNGKRSGAS